MTVDCVTIANNHLFHNNLLAGQHRLRYDSIISRQNWNVPHIEGMEYDQYDNPATTYLVWKDKNHIVRGVSRLYPTDRPFMLHDVFSHMVTYQPLPVGKDILEGSRFCIDKNVAPDLRKIIIQELVVAYLEYGLSQNVTQILGVMYPVYWRNIFEKNGWQPSWLGDEFITPDGKKSRAASLPLSEAVLKQVRECTGIKTNIINYGQIDGDSYVKAA